MYFNIHHNNSHNNSHNNIHANSQNKMSCNISATTRGILLTLLTLMLMNLAVGGSGILTRRRESLRGERRQFKELGDVSESKVPSSEGAMHKKMKRRKKGSSKTEHIRVSPSASSVDGQRRFFYGSDDFEVKSSMPSISPVLVQTLHPTVNKSSKNDVSKAKKLPHPLLEY